MHVLILKGMVPRIIRNYQGQAGHNFRLNGRSCEEAKLKTRPSSMATICLFYWVILEGFESGLK